MGAEVIILFNPYTYNFLKGLTHSAVLTSHAGHSLSCLAWPELARIYVATMMVVYDD